mgnify:CR=1 FL=1
MSAAQPVLPCPAAALAASCMPHTSAPYDSTESTMVLNSCSCTGAAPMPSAALSARQLCIAARAAATLAGAAAPARQQLLWKVMPRYLKLGTTARLAEEGGAEGPPLLEANAGLEAGGEAVSSANAHGRIGIQRLHCPQPAGAEAVRCQLIPQALPRHCVVGFFEVNKTGPQLLTVTAMLILRSTSAACAVLRRRRKPNCPAALLPLASAQSDKHRSRTAWLPACQQRCRAGRRSCPAVRLAWGAG